MQQMMSSMGNVDPGMMQQQMRMMQNLSPADMERMQQQVGSMDSTTLASQAQQAQKMLSAQQKYVLDVSVLALPPLRASPCLLAWQQCV
jgi:phage FluMu protein gp41